MALADRIEEGVPWNAPEEVARRGYPLPPPEAEGRLRSGTKLEAAPFQRWLRRVLFAEERRGASKDLEQRVAKRCGSFPRYLKSWLVVHEIDYNVVERATSAEGRYTVDDLYRLSSPFRVPDDPAAEREPRTISPVSSQCASPGCEERRAPGSRFCPEHRDLFARVKRELDDMDAPQAKTGRKTSRPTCVLPGCDEPRNPPSAFCPSCRAEGAEEVTE